MLPIVATSINPHSRLDYQLRCFNSWRALGFEAYTFNVAGEADILQRKGVKPDSVVVTRKAQTGETLFGKANPRILPVLRYIERNNPGRPLILVNSDIYVAARCGAIARFWLDLAPAVALAREEVVSIEAFNPTGRRRPYRGGLDAFVFRPEALVEVNKALGHFPAAERMCFGVPGWDFFLAALVRSSAVGGTISHSGLLLHEMHRKNYSNIDEFAHYVPPMKHVGAITRDDVTGAAEEFSRIIDAECRKSDDRAERAGSLFGCPVSFEVSSTQPLQVCCNLMARYPWVKWNYDLPAMVALAEKYSRDHSMDALFLRGFFTVSPSEHHRYSEVLLAILFHFLCRPESLGSIRRDYPSGNRHAVGVQLALNASGGKLAATRLELAKLFLHETTQFGIYNRRLLKYLILSCENDVERSLVKEIYETLGARSSVA